MKNLLLLASLLLFTSLVNGQIDVKNGKIGIGMTDATYPVQVQSDSVLFQDKAGINVRMYIGPDGKVGIGTVAPAFKMDIAGTVSRLRGENASMIVQDHTASWNSAEAWYYAGEDAASSSSDLDQAFRFGYNKGKFSLQRGTALDGSSYNEVFTVTGTGNVGIGTSTPEDKLHIETANGSFQVTKYGHQIFKNLAHVGTSKWSIAPRGSGEFTIAYGVPSGDNVVPNTNSKFAINVAGNVGIGTTSPSEKLDVAGKTKTTSLQVTTGAGDGKVLQSDAAGNANWVDPNTLAGANDNLGNHTATSQLDMGDNLIKNTSAIGIGTSSPGYDLDIHSDEVDVARFKRSSSSGVDANIIVQGARNGSTTVDVASISLDNFDNNEGGGENYTMAKVAAGMETTTGNTGYLTFKTNSGNSLSEKMRITKDGKIGIGTTSPSEKLDVAGKTKTTSLQVITGAGDGKVLQSDATGNAIWADPNTLAGANDNLGNHTASENINLNGKWISGDGGNEGVFINTLGSVGIGSAAIESKLDVQTANAVEVGIHTEGLIADASGVGNYVPTSSWNIGSGSVGIFRQNGTTAENSREHSITPYGEPGILWKASPDAVSGADGGWVSTVFSIDHEKTYRSLVWVKRTGTNTTNGRTYLGCAGNVTYLNGNDNNNPYFYNNFLPELDKWYLIVGYVHSSASDITQSLGGVYDAQTGEKIQNTTDYKLKTSTTVQTHRTYLYYSTETGNNQYFWGPRFEEVNGSEPSLAAILGRAEAKIWTKTGTDATYENGNVGIGTTAPDELLHLESALPSIRLQDNTNNYYHRVVGNDDSLIFQADEDNSSGSGDMRFDIGGTEKMRIESNGYIGMGVTDPSTNFHVRVGAATISNPVAAQGILLERDNAAAFTIITPNDKSGRIYFGDPQDSNEGGILYNHVNDRMSFRTLNADRMTIDNAGNVGIGTPIPSEGFHVYDNFNGGAGMRVENASTGTAAFTKYVVQNDIGKRIVNYAFGSNYASSTSLGASRAGKAEIWTNTTTGLNIRSATVGSSITIGTEDIAVMTIDDHQNVGIGTTIPSEKLEIERNSNDFTSLKINNNTVGNSGGSAIDLNSDVGKTFLSAHSSGRTALRYGQSLGGKAELLATAASTGVLIGSTLAVPITLGTANINRLHITGTGNVGIGTTSPSEKLDVAGKTKTISLQITTGAGADKVLQSDASGNATWVDPNTLAGANDNLGNHTASENINLNGKWISGDGGNEGISVDNSGNVGIGITTPRSNLDVSSAIAITDSKNGSQGNGVNNYGDVYSKLEFKSDDANSYLTSDKSNAWIQSAHLRGGTGHAAADAGLQFITTSPNDWGGSVQMTIDNYGKVGIGTTSPSEKLDVAGKTKTTSLQVTTGAGADKVLQSDAAGNASWVDPNTLAGANDNLGDHVATSQLHMNGERIHFTSNNVMIASNSGNTSMTGSQNNFIGSLTGVSNTTGAYNNFLGYHAGRYNTTGKYNNFMGHRSGEKNTTASHNTFFGYLSGLTNTTGHSNNFFGNQTGRLNTTGSHNNFFGTTAGYSNTTGSHNQFLGNIAGRYNTTGSYNGFFGYATGYQNTTGNYNYFIGTSAGRNNTTGHYNLAIGANSLYNSIAGNGNIALGYHAGYETNGGYNTILGYNTGRGIAAGNYNTIIGAQVTGLSPTLSNHIILADGQGNQRIVADEVGNVGIGTTDPLTTLEVQGPNDSWQSTFGKGGVWNGDQGGWKRIVFGARDDDSSAVGYDVVLRTSDGSGKLLLQDGTGNVGIGIPYQTTPESKLHINAGTLSASNGDKKDLFKLQTTNPHNSRLEFTERRNSNANTWETASTRISKYTDVTEQGYLEFNPAGVPGGIALGGGNQEFLTITGGGQLKLDLYTGANYTATPTSILGVDASGNVVKSDLNTLIDDIVAQAAPAWGAPQAINFNQVYTANYNTFIVGSMATNASPAWMSLKIDGLKVGETGRDGSAYKSISFAIPAGSTYEISASSTNSAYAYAVETNSSNTSSAKTTTTKEKGESQSPELREHVSQLESLLQEQGDMIKQLQKEIEEIRNLDHLTDLTNQINVSLSNSMEIEQPYISQNIPNPTSNSAIVKYYVPETATDATVKFFSLSGQLMKEVALDQLGQGEIKLDLEKMMTGSYMYALIVDGELIDTKTMVIVK